MLACGLATKKELFNNAFDLFDWAIQETLAGKAIASVDRKANHFEVMQTPVLRKVAKRAQREPVSPIKKPLALSARGEKEFVGGGGNNKEPIEG
jgi:hypothetical protein